MPRQFLHRDQIADQLRLILGNALERVPEEFREDIPLNRLFREVLELDSLDTVELMMELEESFDFALPDTDFEVITFRDLVELIFKHQR